MIDVCYMKFCIVSGYCELLLFLFHVNGVLRFLTQFQFEMYMSKQNVLSNNLNNHAIIFFQPILVTGPGDPGSLPFYWIYWMKNSEGTLRLLHRELLILTVSDLVRAQRDASTVRWL